ncbi:chlorophyll synthesis pathway protein BchC [Aquabacterium sp.]|uniref:chlorophyll synthesis pathway protein BchC n=1 Tax=Aquabacterium sp. TaxID=1872578 RepID=UPI0037849CDF
MNSWAVVMQQPGSLALTSLPLQDPGDEDIVVDVEWSGISTGTERLLWTGRMPAFPGMGYPLVPGYESVGRVRHAGPRSGHVAGERVFVPGARCYGEVRGLFGGAASRVVLPGARAVTLADSLGEQAVLLALAATAYHAVARGGRQDPIVPPDLIVGHGVMGRLLARLNVAAGCSDFTVWETDATRREGAQGYRVVDPAEDPRRDYRAIYDVSGDAALLDTLVQRLAPGGQIVLAGFYSEPLRFAYAPAFMREVQIRCAAEWHRNDLLAVTELAAAGVFSLDGLITHHDRADHAEAAYRTAFGDAACLKMVLDWRHCA